MRFESREVVPESVAAWFQNMPEPVSENLSRYQRKITDYLLEICRLDGLRSLPGTGSLPWMVMKYYQKAVNLYDEAIYFFLGSLRRSGMSVQCREGCSLCCYQMPTGLTSMELVYLYHGMHQTGSPSRLLRRCLEAEEVLCDIYGQIRTGSFLEPENVDPRTVLLTQYHQKQRPCPFLQEDRCLVYPYRPFACRMHFSLSPRYLCHPSRLGNSGAIQFNMELGQSVLDALDKLQCRMRLDTSDVLVCGILELAVNVLRFEPLTWS
ncbi:MAG: hypothetical protein KBH99_02105 [Syntrophobacteraceae bacterium]|nr:hypothetical protein [Syntrophobacteraceae bacterium]